ncbi:hypothetical protein ATO6_10115 [Oceanicola sp. 22II-s10i]|uniref:hypothetical protein n=1 Tax=Oceanicola sp. 22II-s10i TaxID=1317116 RepID=UPI000B5239E5|nr:hypothetical protein [Oceanicola sp. 22II-s10i]OWU84697.1 hypothetical protein ATO6_10115 [Oceanicola sp. 22II-s10i]
MADTMTIPAVGRLSGRTRIAAGALGALLLVAACDDGGSVSDGINSLGSDFLRVFNQDPNAEPVQNVQSLNLALTPMKEPFNP